VEVDIVANVGEPGLGAWTVDPTWDTDVLSPVRCVPYNGGVCSMNFASDTGRVTGASMTGIVGEATLATLVFRCGDEPGVSELTLSIEVFADATPDVPQSINETVTDGAIGCVEPVPTEAPAPTATVAPQRVLPPTGQGGTASTSSTWPLGLLAFAGAASFVAALALRRPA
jgi:hypothetical protein